MPDPSETHWNDILEPLVEGRRFLLAFDILVQAFGHVHRLNRLGAGDLMAIGARRGVGELPDPERCPAIDLAVPTAPSMMGGIRTAIAAMKALPDEVQAQVDAFDPEGEARVVGSIFWDGTPVAGRPVLGGRRPAWMALEEKVAIDAVWDSAGVPRAPTVRTRVSDIEAAIRSVDAGSGVVLAGDAREGFNGGAELVRWVRDAGEREEARATFAYQCDEVRVMPFLEGLPCSIHGIVFPDRTLAFRPVEMLVLRRPGSSRFQYTGAATYWDAPESDAEEMRAIVRRVGEHLRASIGYRGAFTIDGVLTTDGFRPTELNPRVGAAMPKLFAEVDLHTSIFNRLLIEHWDTADVDWQAEALERRVLDTSAARRSGHAMLQTTRPLEDDVQHVQFTGAGCVPSEESAADATLVAGPGPMGGIVFLRPKPKRIPSGPSFAPRVAQMAAFADAHWSLGIGALHPAPEVR